MKKATVTIGIPAYNEEANLELLLKDIFKQAQSNFILQNIIVASDGSMDKTVFIANKYKNKKVITIDNKARLGLANMQNQILGKSNSDIVAILNADILIKDKDFINKIIQPILDGKADLTCSAMRELPSPTFIGKILNVSLVFKTWVFEKYHDGNNIYTCHGTARAFGRKLYKNLKFKDSVGEDAYSYLFATANNYVYEYVKSAKGFYQLPTNLSDHQLQSVRYLKSKKRFIKEFGPKLVSESYKIPISLMIEGVFRHFLRYPIYMSLYFLIFGGLKVKSLFTSDVKDKWDIAKSSKYLRFT